MITVSDRIRFIQSVFGTGKVSGGNITVHCPECKNVDSGKKKLSIRLDDEMNHCWVCGWGGRNLLQLVIRHGTREQVLDYRQRFLPEVADTRKFDVAIENKEEEKVVKLPSDFKLLATCVRPRDPDIKAVLRYVQDRGLSERDMWYWRLGISNDKTFRRRVIMPSFDASGNLNYYVGRAVDKISYMKYVNCDAVKTKIVFNELNIDWSKKLTIVEGPFDLMKCNRLNATCLLGSSLMDDNELFTQIVLHNTPVVLMLDDDMKSKTQAIAKNLAVCDIDVWIATHEGFHDPGEMSFSDVEKSVEDAKRWTWNTLFTHKLDDAMRCKLRI